MPTINISANISINKLSFLWIINVLIIHIYTYSWANTDIFRLQNIILFFSFIAFYGFLFVDFFYNI